MKWGWNRELEVSGASETTSRELYVEVERESYSAIPWIIVAFTSWQWYRASWWR